MDDRPEIEECPPQIRVTGWCTEKDNADGMQPIDILEDHAMRATNCADVRSAIAMLQLAANAGALSLLVCKDRYRHMIYCINFYLPLKRCKMSLPRKRLCDIHAIRAGTGAARSATGASCLASPSSMCASSSGASGCPLIPRSSSWTRQGSTTRSLRTFRP